MLKKLIYQLFFLSLLLNFSCANTTTKQLIHHSPSEPNMMKLSEKGDLKVSGSKKEFSENDKDTFYNFQLGYSPKQNLGISFSRSFMESNR